MLFLEKNPLHFAHGIKSTACLFNFFAGRRDTIKFPLLMLGSVLYIKFPVRLIIAIIFFRSGLPKICK